MPLRSKKKKKRRFVQIEGLVTDAFLPAKLESFQPKATRNILFVINKLK